MSSILNIALTGLRASQAALETTAHNVSNAASPSYSRQRVELAALEPLQITGGYMGKGVGISEIRRITDDITNRELRNAQNSESYYQLYTQYASQINSFLSEDATSVNNSVRAFFNALQDASQDPADVTRRQAVLSSAQLMVSQFNTTYGRMSELITEVNAQIGEIVSAVNATSQNIAALNQQIMADTGSGMAVTWPNDLLDNRDALLQQLAGYLKTGVISQSNHASVTVLVGTGQPLVIEQQPMGLGTKHNENDPTLLDIVQLVDGQVITNHLTGGQLGALFDVRNQLIEPTLNALGTLATSLASVMNQQHQLGLDLKSQLGGLFFSDLNASALSLGRAVESSTNQGNAVLAVTVNDVARPPSGPYQVVSNPGGLVQRGTLGSLTNPGVLTLNGVAVRATTPADDGLSISDQAASGIALAAAINDSVSGVTATVQSNTVFLGAFTPGALANGDFVLNGVSIVTPGATTAALVTAVNAQTPLTGIVATADAANNVTLYAPDGRNIRLQHGTTAAVGTFANFQLTGVLALDQIQRATVVLNASSTPISVGGTAPLQVGLLPGVTPASSATLTTSNYSLSFNGAIYNLTRLSDGVVVTSGTSPNLSADGFTVSLASGSMASQDHFLIRPTRNAASQIALSLTNPAQLAFACPIRATAATNNQGNGLISIDRGPVNLNSFSRPQTLTPPINIAFITPTSYQVYDASTGVPIGGAQPYNPNARNSIFPIFGVSNTTGAAGSPPLVFDPGYRVSITGTVHADGVQQDGFSIAYNANGVSDGLNLSELLKIQKETIMVGETEDFESFYGNISSQMGMESSSSKQQWEASKEIRRNALANQRSISGVNLDEEVVRLLEFQKLYQAASRLVMVEKQLFDSLIAAF